MILIIAIELIYWIENLAYHSGSLPKILMKFCFHRSFWNSYIFYQTKVPTITRWIAACSVCAQILRPFTLLASLCFADRVETAFGANQDLASRCAPLEATWALGHLWTYLWKPFCFWKYLFCISFLISDVQPTWLESNEDQTQSNCCPLKVTARHLAKIWVCKSPWSVLSRQKAPCPPWTCGALAGLWSKGNDGQLVVQGT